MPGSFAVPVPVEVPVAGAGGRATLPLAEVSDDDEPLPVADPLPLAAPVSVPDVVGLLGDAEVVGLVLVSSADGVSDGEVRVRCIPVPAPELRPWPEVFPFFLIFLSFDEALELGTDSVELPAAELPLLTLPELSFPIAVDVDAPPRLGTALDDVSRFEVLSGCGWAVFALVSDEGVAFEAGLLLGSELLLLEVFDEFPGRALLFWSAGSVAVPLSSVVWLFGVLVVLWSALPVPVAVCARAPTAASASAMAIMVNVFI